MLSGTTVIQFAVAAGQFLTIGRCSLGSALGFLGRCLALLVVLRAVLVARLGVILLVGSDIRSDTDSHSHGYGAHYQGGFHISILHWLGVVGMSALADIPTLLQAKWLGHASRQLRLRRFG